jgi:hypothetical protein
MEDPRGSGRIPFRDVLAQVIGLLVLEGRLSYRALAVQFDLDDESLEALRIELVRIKRLAIDEDGESLAWAGRPLVLEANAAESRAAAPPVPPLPPLTFSSTRPRPTANDGGVAPRAAPEPSAASEATISSGTLPSAPGAAGAERRQLTVMFCDLVGSTELAGGSIPRTSARWCEPIRTSRRAPSAASTARSRSISATASSRTSVIRTRTRTTPGARSRPASP